MGAFDKLPPRSPVTAFSITAYNAMLDMLNWWKTERGGGGRHGGGGFPPRGDVGWIKNNSGADRERFDILGISDVLYDEAEAPDEFKNKRPLVGVTPNAALHVGKFAILLEPVANGAMGRACVSGLCVVQLYVHEGCEDVAFADVRPGATGDDCFHPAADSWGDARILYRDGGTDLQWAVVRLGDGCWERRFELKTALTPGSSATAHPLKDNDTADTTEAREFTVYDVLEQFRGRAKDAYESPHDRGSQGVARYCAAAKEWQIVSLQPAALMIRGALTAALATTDVTFTIDGLTVMQPPGAVMTDQDPAQPITVYNVFHWKGDDNGVCIAAWNDDEAGRWDALNVECPAE